MNEWTVKIRASGGVKIVCGRVLKLWMTSASPQEIEILHQITREHNVLEKVKGILEQAVVKNVKIGRETFKDGFCCVCSRLDDGRHDENCFILQMEVLLDELERIKP